MIDFASLILDEDSAFVFVNKPPGLAVQSRDHRDLMEMAEMHYAQQMYPCHRIDQPCSGTVVLAKSSHASEEFRKALLDQRISRIYLAVVATLPELPSGELRHRIAKSSSGNRMVISTRRSAKLAVLKYRTIGSSTHYHLLEVRLETGRQHQIRAQLGAIGSPIKGDNKYGFKRGNRDRSIHLHAWKFSLSTPKFSYEHCAGLPDDPLWNAFAQDLESIRN